MRKRILAVVLVLILVCTLFSNTIILSNAMIISDVGDTGNISIKNERDGNAVRSSFSPVWPTSGTYQISCLYYYSSGLQHRCRYGYQNAIDIAGNGEALSVESGSVIDVAYQSDGFGNYIVIQHDNGGKSLYGHLATTYVSEGATVGRGQKIGKIGNTGGDGNMGIHLHYEYSLADPFRTFYKDNYYADIRFEPGCYDNNLKNNSDKFICDWISSYYQKNSNGIYIWNGTSPSINPQISVSKTELIVGEEITLTYSGLTECSQVYFNYYKNGQKYYSQDSTDSTSYTTFFGESGWYQVSVSGYYNGTWYESELLDIYVSYINPQINVDKTVLCIGEEITMEYSGLTDCTEVVFNYIKNGEIYYSQDSTSSRIYKTWFENAGKYQISASGYIYGNWYESSRVDITVYNHNYSYVATTKPTTSGAGTLTGTCSKCSGTTSVTLPKLNTTDYTYKVTKEATCTATGTERYTWEITTYGSFYFDVTIEKIPHDYKATVTDPTCTAQGYTTHKCSACGDNYKDTYTDPLGHNYSYKVTTAPTTLAAGKLTGTCSRCNGTTTVTLPKLNTTDYTYKVTKEATCTATGTGRYTWKTTTYGTFYFDVTIAKIPHDYKATVTAPTCTAQGYTTHKCSACGDSYKDTYTDPLGHNYSYKVTTAPTTLAAGKLTGTCSRCNGTTTVTLPKLNTTDYTYKVTKEATCTATGTGRYTWKTTTYGTFYFDVTIAKIPHDYKATVTAPTCTAQGYTTHKCSVCGDNYKDTYTDPLGHNYSYKVTTTPTTSATGKLTGTCSRCSGTTTVTLPKLNTTDYTYKVTKEATCTATGTGRYTWKTTTYGTFYFDVTIAKTPHDYKAVVTNPTCEAQGYTTHTCTKCQDSYKDSYKDALGHNYSYKVTTTPTTSATGKLTGTCSRCSGTTTVTLPKLNTTDYTYKVTKEATCTATGTGRYTWEITTYGSFYFDVTLGKIPHDYKATVTAPTCTEQGYTTYKCSVCGNTYVDSYVAALGHAESDWIVDFNATCTASGSKHTQCTRCGVTMQTSVIPATGHNESEWIVDKNATCTASGYKHTECLTCGVTIKAETIPAAGHSYQDYLTAPTCTERGFTTHTCSSCNDSYVDSYVDALGHEWDAGSISQEPTCTQDGIKLFNCNRCSETKTESVKATGHNYTDSVTAPTCTESGYTAHICSVCGDNYTDTSVEALGHAWDEGTVTIEPTETETGVRTYTCERCAETRTEDIPVLEHTHSYAESVIAPTCTEQGYTVYTCVCGDSYVSDEVPAMGHSYSNGACVNCGVEAPDNLLNNPFVDVKENDYFYTSVLWAVQKGITNGTTATTFSPNDPCTRGQIVTFLWRACGSPEPTSTQNPFTDVKSNEYYYKAVLWAVEEGITTGISATKFGPTETCTRGQVATFLWRSQGKPITASSNNPFKDVKSNEYYYNAVLWAIENSITNGTGIDTFSPEDSCTRGQIVTFLYRANTASEMMAKFDAENYEIVIENCTWQEAQEAAVAKGGNLVAFESMYEYRFVLNLIATKGDASALYYIGARRDMDGATYHWVDGSELVGEPLNTTDAWCYELWQKGEPNLDWNGEAETVAVLYNCADEARWCWYDGPSDRCVEGWQYAYIIEY